MLPCRGFVERDSPSTSACIQGGLHWHREVEDAEGSPKELALGGQQSGAGREEGKLSQNLLRCAVEFGVIIGRFCLLLALAVVDAMLEGIPFVGSLGR